MQDHNPKWNQEEEYERHISKGPLGHLIEGIREGLQGCSSSSIERNRVRHLRMNSAIIGETFSFIEITQEHLL